MNRLQFKPYLIALSVADIDESTRWYQEKLGFVLRRNMDFPEYELRIAFLELHDFRLELIEKKDSFAIQERMPEIKDTTIVRGWKKLAFQVEDIHPIANELKARDAKFIRDITENQDYFDGPVRSFIVEDKDGNWLQFFQKIGRNTTGQEAGEG